MIGNVIDCTDLKLVPVAEDEASRLRLEDGDVLFVRTNGNPDNVGRSAVFDRQAVAQTGFPPERFIFASYLIRARPRADVLESSYLQHYLTTPTGRQALRERSRTAAGQYNISASGLGTIPVPLPSIDQQRAFVEEVAALVGLRMRQATARSTLEELGRALRYRVFRGEV